MFFKSLNKESSKKLEHFYKLMIKYYNVKENMKFFIF